MVEQVPQDDLVRQPRLRGTTHTHKVNLARLAEQLAPGNGVRLQYIKPSRRPAPQKWDRGLRLLGIRTDRPESLDVRSKSK